MMHLQSFDPLANSQARILILGSMPGKVSLEAYEYYAHSRNAFWKVMESLLGIETHLDYNERCSLLIERKVALWDVLKSCVRSSSLDSDIVEQTIVPNDFLNFFENHESIEAVYFNGSKAENVYKRYVLPDLSGWYADMPMIKLPSTSPAHAAVNFEGKLKVWSQLSELKL